MPIDPHLPLGIAARRFITLSAPARLSIAAKVVGPAGCRASIAVDGQEVSLSAVRELHEAGEVWWACMSERQPVGTRVVEIVTFGQDADEARLSVVEVR